MTETPTFSEFALAQLYAGAGDPSKLEELSFVTVSKFISLGYMSMDSTAVGAGALTTDAGKAYLASLSKENPNA